MADDDATTVERAGRLAVAAHAGQVDKAGNPYWTHPERVARRVRELYPGAPDAAVATAWLHDVVEDTGVTEAELRDVFPAEVVDAVVALTRRPDVDADDYYANIRAAGGIALMAKHADIMDNLDAGRLASLEPSLAARLREKYAKALVLLGLTG